MVRDRQRQRQLARDRYERQRVRRSTRAARRRRIGILAGVIVALVALVLLGWLIAHLYNADDPATPVPTTPAVPTNFSDLPTGPSSDVPSSEVSQNQPSREDPS